MAQTNLSPLACTPCRRRKIKCDKTIPGCTVCSKSRVECVYPAGPLKPGPKLGASRRETDSRSRRMLKPTAGTPSRSRKRARSASLEDDPPVWRDRSPYQDRHGSGSGKGDAPRPLQGHPSAIYEISSILHPSHGNRRQDDQSDDYSKPATAPNQSSSSNPAVFSEACSLLGISVDVAHELIDIYMFNFCAFLLFHQPSFATKIQLVSSPQALGALLGSMFIFSARFAKKTRGFSKSSRLASSLSTLTPTHFELIAIELQEKALKACGDEPPPLFLLQSFILTTFQHLTRGVRGIAWRHLGTCLRLAYELDLHCIDASSEDSGSEYDASMSIEVEERRRAWWAIWEMDTFASIIRRSPTAINWHDNETFLPIKDDFWYNGTKQPSCFLAPKPMNRWRNLQKSGNESCKAWFIVVNSLMRDAQNLSDPRGLFSDSRQCSSKSSLMVSEDLSVISNSLRCLTIALPNDLQYQGEYLTFGSGDTRLGRQLDGSKHGIYLMIQLTHLIIDHFEAFRACSGDSHISLHGNPSSQRQNGLLVLSEQQRQALNRFVLAADKAFTMVSRCADDHVQAVNPFLASSVWIAAAVQLVQKYFGSSSINLDLVDSKFEFLRMNYKQYVEFWDTPSVLEERLDSLERQFKKLHTLERNGSLTHMEKPTDTRYFTHEHKAPHILDNMSQNLPQAHAISQPVQSIRSQLPPSSSLSTFQQSSELNTEPRSLTSDAFLTGDQFPTPSQSNARTTFEESIDFPYDDGSLNDFGFGLQAGGELDFPNFLNTLFSGSYDQI